MVEKVDQFSNTYSKFSDETLAEVRRETFGTDIGQNSWTLRSEYLEFIESLGLSSGHQLLDVACGAGGPAVFCASKTGCSVVGVDHDPSGIRTAVQRAHDAGIADRARFQVVDARATLPFEDRTFDSIICIDAVIHFPDRLAVLRDWFRILKPGGRVLYTDPVVITGLVTDEELALRSSIANFTFAPPNEDERLLRAAGFRIRRVADLTSAMAQVAGAWHAARARHQAKLLEVEGKERFDGSQRFFDCVHRLAAEHRLSRIMFLGERGETVT